ncbi:alpha-amylase [Bifidobacterium goeldii]|nr:alpha-amylase family protein [Bifidobacterium goeldii]
MTRQIMKRRNGQQSILQRALATAATLALTAAMLCTPASPLTPSAHAEISSVNRGDVIVIAFQTNWRSVARECTETYGPEGVGYVQVSPPQETITGTQWWTSYQPVSYKLDSKLGTEAEFTNMIATCKAAGVGVIADAVINHMAGADRSGTGVAGSKFDGEGNFPAVPYTPSDFHDCTENIINYSNADNVQNCRLSGLQDLDTGNANVRSKIVDYMAKLLDLGVAGFRVDAVKHIAAADVAALKSELLAKTGLDENDFLFEQEVIGSTSEAKEIQPVNYLGTGKVSEFNVNARLKQAFNGDINSATFGLSGIGTSSSWVPSNKAAVWVTNWDTERGDNALTYKDGSRYLLANAFLLAYNYGQPHVYAGYYFNNNDAGAPSASTTQVPDMKCPTDGSQTSGTWQCTQRWTAIRGMIGFHNAVAHTKVTDWKEYGDNVVGFGRADKGYLAINNSESPLEATFTTSLPAGTYCNVYAVGDCSKTVTVHRDGTFTATVGAGSAIAIHVGAQPATWTSTSLTDPTDPSWFVQQAKADGVDGKAPSLISATAVVAAVVVGIACIGVIVVVVCWRVRRKARS